MRAEFSVRSDALIPEPLQEDDVRPTRWFPRRGKGILGFEDELV